jgi:hypothetical protein
MRNLFCKNKMSVENNLLFPFGEAGLMLIQIKRLWDGLYVEFF